MNISSGQRVHLLRQLHHLSGWREVTDDTLNCVPLTLSFTNTVVKCEFQDSSNCKQEVLARFYGENSDALYKRWQELLMYELVDGVGLGPKILRKFDIGRIETFLTDYSPLLVEEMRDVDMSIAIAKHLAEFHHKLMKEYNGRCNAGSFSQLPTLHERLKDWYETARNLTNCQKPLLENSSNFVSLMEQLLCKNQSTFAVIHCDLQCGNIMKQHHHHPNGGLCFIDYEYGCLGPIEFDIANHWCEWCSEYLSDQPHILKLLNFPSPMQQRIFLESYLTTQRCLNSRKNDSAKELPKKGVESAITESIIENMRLRVLDFIPMSHLIWSLWSILQNERSNPTSTRITGNSTTTAIHDDDDDKDLMMPDSSSKHVHFNLDAYACQRLECFQQTFVGKP